MGSGTSQKYEESSIEKSRSKLSDSNSKTNASSEEPIADYGTQNTNALARTIASNSQSPNLQPHQHASLFYLSLIEGRCRKQAAKSINNGRVNHLTEDHPDVDQLTEVLFEQVSKELRQVGMIPQELVIPSVQELRRYSASFDMLLSNVATRQPPNLFESSVLRAIEADDASSLFERSQPRSIADSNLFSYSDEASSLFDRSESQALVPQHYNILPQQAYLSNLIVPPGILHSPRDSNYARKFKEICLLGKGGFGQVYCAQHFLDGQQYAVKKIRITATQLRSITSEVDAKPLLAELRALANLQQRNVVRYFDSWIETRPAAGLEQNLIALGELSELSSSESQPAIKSETISRITSGLQSLRIDHENSLRRDDEKRRRDSMAEPSGDGMIVFEASAASTRTGSTRNTKSSNRSKSSRKPSLFRKPSEVSSDEDTEELPREEGFQHAGNEHDVVIFIQMALHPMTLEDFLWPDQQNSPKHSQIRHCFHTPTTTRIALAILDGIDYIHSKQIVHRDLKPSNIFLSVVRGQAPPEGAINITACSECPQSTYEENIYIIPHIGDFGLIAKIEDSASQNVAVPSSPNPSPIAMLSSVAAFHQPGTRFYCAPDVVPRVICPKLDIYSLGVIMFEMLWEFGTKSERQVVLGELGKGIMPAKFDDHVMAPALKGMLKKEREKRWDCARVREFLNNL